MTALVKSGWTDYGGVAWPTIQLSLYCWRHEKVHILPATDVEKLVYALGADATDRGPGITRRMFPCWEVVIKEWATSPEIYADDVQQSIAYRKAEVC